MKRIALFVTVLIAVAIALPILILNRGNDVVKDSVPEPLGDTVWAYTFPTLQEMTEFADLVVVGEVVSSQFGRTNGAETYPLHYTYVSVEVEDILKGQLKKRELVLEMLGSSESIWFKGMPEFGIGERHILFLRTKKDPTSAAEYMILSPTGRYKIMDGSLQVTSRDYQLAKTMDGRSLKAVKTEVIASR